MVSVRVIQIPLFSIIIDHVMGDTISMFLIFGAMPTYDFLSLTKKRAFRFFDILQWGQYLTSSTNGKLLRRDLNRWVNISPFRSHQTSDGFYWTMQMIDCIICSHVLWLNWCTDPVMVQLSLLSKCSVRTWWTSEFFRWRYLNCAPWNYHSLQVFIASLTSDTKKSVIVVDFEIITLAVKNIRKIHSNKNSRSSRVNGFRVNRAWVTDTGDTRGAKTAQEQNWIQEWIFEYRRDRQILIKMF